MDDGPYGKETSVRLIILVAFVTGFLVGATSYSVRLWMLPAPYQIPEAPLFLEDPFSV